MSTCRMAGESIGIGGTASSSWNSIETPDRFVNASIMSKPTWRNTWYKAQVLHDTGKHGEARKQLQQAMTLGKGDRIYEDYYKPQLAKALADWPQS